jgi:hypothetical protein
MIYMALYVMIFDACRSITLASGSGLGPGNLKFIGSMPFHRAQKTLDFQGTTPFPLALVMDLHASKTKGHINHRCINSYL